MQSSPGGTTPRTLRSASPGATTLRSASSEGMTSASAIEARGLVKTYPGPGKTRVRALDGLTLSVRRGSIFALVGPNGAGKTTTVKILTTLATPDEGAAAIEGIDVIAAPGRARRVIGVVHRPQVLFLDEPTTGLDPESRSAMWDEITGLATADKVTVLLTTHYLDEADKLADSLAIVDKGRVVAEGEPERLKSELGAGSLDEVYLHHAGRRYSDATRVTEVAGR